MKDDTGLRHTPRDGPPRPRPPLPAAPAGAASFFRRLGFDSLLGRYAYVAGLLIVFLVGAAWLAHVRVDKATARGVANSAERHATKQRLRAVFDGVWATETTFQSYMLVPTKERGDRVHAALAHVADEAGTLSGDPWVAANPAARDDVHRLSDQLARLSNDIRRVMSIRVDVERLFPAMPIMLERMLPAYTRFYTAATLAMDEADAEPDNRDQVAIYRLFMAARHSSTLMIGDFRNWVANRFGIFGEAESAMRAQANNIALHADMVDHYLAKLAELEQGGTLGLQQGESLKTMRATHATWKRDYQAAARIFTSDRWRTDTPLVRDTIQPALAAIWQTLRDLERGLDAHSAEDMGVLARTADHVSGSLWLLVVIGVTVTGLGLLLFEVTLRRPLTRVTGAIKAEAAGTAGVIVPQTQMVETQDLIQAFDQMREQVRSRQHRLQAVLDYAAEAVVTTDEHGIIETFNPAAEKLFGYPRDEVIGKEVGILMPGPAASAHQGHMKRYCETGASRVLGKEREQIARRADGSSFPIAIKVSEMFVDGRRMFTALIADISERKAMLEQLQARELRLSTILDNTAEGIITFDEWGRIEGFNKAAEKLFGWPEDEAAGASVAELIVQDRRDKRDGYLEHLMRTEIQRLIGHEGEVTGRHRDGTTFPMSLKISAMTLNGRQMYIGLAADISERKAMVEHLKKMAEHDGLTGLYNRTYFQDELERVVERVRRSETASCALLYIDLDHFKYVNDTLGHAAGDRLLVEIAAILNKRARKSDLIARLGGDEFTVLLYDTTAATAEKVADSFRKRLVDYTFKQGSERVDVGCSIGVAVVGPGTGSAAEVLAQADVACHLAKRGGRNRVHVFRSEDAANVTTMSLDMGWSRRIKRAIENDRFALACQPIVNTETREIEMYEVLIRMRDENDELVMPGGFLPTAERFGLSLDIDRWVIVHAIAVLAEQHAVCPDIRYSINLSAQTLTDPTICDFIQQQIRTTGLDPAALVFEVTETVAISDMAAAETLLSQLRGLGCKTALDDFGSGMSSFAYLRDLPVDIVKIDGRFVKNLAASAVDQVMVRAMNEIAHALDKLTVAEFVEDEATFRLLGQIGVNYGQGYHLGRPEISMPCKAIAEHGGGKICRH